MIFYFILLLLFFLVVLDDFWIKSVADERWGLLGAFNFQNNFIASAACSHVRYGGIMSILSRLAVYPYKITVTYRWGYAGPSGAKTVVCSSSSCL